MKELKEEIIEAVQDATDTVDGTVSIPILDHFLDAILTEQCSIPDVMGSTPREKWENLKKYILTQTEKIDKETPCQNTEPEWWLEMQTIEKNVRQYCS